MVAGLVAILTVVWWTHAVAWTWYAFIGACHDRRGVDGCWLSAGHGMSLPPDARPMRRASSCCERRSPRAFPGRGRRGRRRRDGSLWREAFGTLTYDPDAPAADDGHDLRSRVAHEGDRDDDARDAPGRTRARCGSTTASATLLPGLARRRSRDGHGPRSARALLGPDRVSAVLPRSRRPRGVRARHLHDAARVPAAHAVDLQRPRLHAARVHPRGRWRRAARTRSSTALRRRARTRSRCWFTPPRRWRAAHRADRSRLLARPPARGEVHDENARGARRRRRTRRAVRHGAAPSARSRGSCCRRSRGATHAGAGGRRWRHVRRRARTCPAARARSAGTRCCRLRRAARGCRRAPSATPASPARRCGSIRSATLRRAAHQPRAPVARQRGDSARSGRAFHDAVMRGLAIGTADRGIG